MMLTESLVEFDVLVKQYEKAYQPLRQVAEKILTFCMMNPGSFYGEDKFVTLLNKLWNNNLIITFVFDQHKSQVLTPELCIPRIAGYLSQLVEIFSHHIVDPKVFEADISAKCQELPTKYKDAIVQLSAKITEFTSQFYNDLKQQLGQLYALQYPNVIGPLIEGLREEVTQIQDPSGPLSQQEIHNLEHTCLGMVLWQSIKLQKSELSAPMSGPKHRYGY